MKTPSNYLPLLLIPALACDVATDDFDGANPALLGAPVGKADGAEVALRDGGGAFDILQIRADAAVDLFGVMSDAGGFHTATINGLQYVYGWYSICVSNGAAAACNVYSRDAQLGGGEGLLAKVHGPRFHSAASELFGAVARANGTSPASVQVTSSERFICAKDASDVWCGVVEPTSTDRNLELSFSGLPALGEDFVYEGWLITADGPITSGRFSIEDNQDSVQMPVSAELAQASNMFVLTIEPAVGDDPEPSETHIVAGVFEDGQAVLHTDHPAALGTDFLGSSGGFILETPTSGAIADDYRQGVWFLEPAAGPGAGLDLPELPSGWAYEGWVVTDDGSISTGKFVDPAAEDRDGGGPAAGPDGAPPFPGQDFIAPPLDLVDTMVVVSVEPDPDDGPAPFALKPLAGPVVDAGPGGFQTLDNIASSNQITGLAVLEPA